VPQLPLKLDRLRRAAVKIARLAAVFAFAHRQLIGIAECDEAWLTAQLIHLAAERDLMHDWPHLVAYSALRLVGLGARAWAGHATGACYLDVGIAVVALRVLLELAQTSLAAEVAECQVAADRRHEGFAVGGDVLAALRAKFLALLELIATTGIAEALQVLSRLQSELVLVRGDCRVTECARE